VEREINRLIERKRRTDLHVISLEAAIYALETEYFREAAPLGSILTPAGMDAYLGAGAAPLTSTAATPGPRKATGAQSTLTEAERIFSNTSSSYQRVSLPRKSRPLIHIRIHLQKHMQNVLGRSNLARRHSPPTHG